MMADDDTATTIEPWIGAARQLLGDNIDVISEPQRIVSASAGETHIRSWPGSTPVEHVRAIRALTHRVDATAVIPAAIGDADACISMGDVIYDAVSSTQGRSLSRHGSFRVPGHGIVAVPLHETADHGDMLVRAANTLGKVHSATRDATELEQLDSMSALTLHQAASDRWQLRRKRLGRQAASIQEARRWLRCGNRVVPISERLLQEASDHAAESNTLIHGNLWPTHLLVDDPSTPEHLSGLVGWQTAMAGSPVIDLAQLSVRVTGWSGASVESILGAYSDHADLQPVVRRLVPVVAAVDLLDQVGYLLEIAWLDDRVANDPAQPFIRGGIKVLLRSLERLTNVLAPPEPPPRRTFGPRRANPGNRPPRKEPRRSAAGRSRPQSSGRRRRAG